MDKKIIKFKISRHLNPLDINKILIDADAACYSDSLSRIIVSINDSYTNFNFVFVVTLEEKPDTYNIPIVHYIYDVQTYEGKILSNLTLTPEEKK